MTGRGLEARAFATAAAFRAWLEARHGTAKELLVRCYKNHASDRGMTYAQALDEALCFGWIDGVRRRVDADSFSVRFSPRKPKSAWSAANLRRVRELESAGRLRPPGLAALRAWKHSGATPHSYDSRPKTLDPASLKKLRANRRAWTFFESQLSWYRRTSAFWVMSAKRPETRGRRLAALIAGSESGKTLPLLTR
jgi:uncharacterized protein YdeI (YjbR/CyaY-like superfamily)